MGVTAAVAAVVGTTYAVYSGEEAKKDRKEMARQQEAANVQTLAETKKQTETSQQEINRANQRRPDTQAAMANAEMATGGGASGTMLTGPQGIDPQQLALGKNTLLGG
jgi:BioD-like phosphotransacetylase family protein